MKDYDVILDEMEKVHCDLGQGTGIEMLVSMMGRFGSEELILVARWLAHEKPCVYITTSESSINLPHVRYERSSWDAFVKAETPTETGGFLIPTVSDIRLPGRRAKFWRSVGNRFDRPAWYAKGVRRVNNRKVFKEAWVHLQEMEAEKQALKDIAVMPPVFRPGQQEANLKHIREAIYGLGVEWSGRTEGGES